MAKNSVFRSIHAVISFKLNDGYDGFKVRTRWQCQYSGTKFIISRVNKDSNLVTIKGSNGKYIRGLEESCDQIFPQCIHDLARVSRDSYRDNPELYHFELFIERADNSTLFRHRGQLLRALLGPDDYNQGLFGTIGSHDGNKNLDTGFREYAFTLEKWKGRKYCNNHRVCSRNEVW